jgi:cytochrome c-type biogenesis protein CcmF
VVAVLVALGLAVAGMRNGWAMMSISLAGFVLGTVLQEFQRGIGARMRMYDEVLPLALIRLVNRNRRRYGGYLVHVGILVYFVAFAGMAFKTSREATLSPGETASLESPYGHTYTFTHLGVSQYNAFNRVVSAATLEVARDGTKIGVIKSEKRQHVDSFGEKTFEPSTEVGIMSDLREDIYVVYAGSIGGTERANFAITINPLVWWVWAGGAILVFGGLLAMWPGGRPVGRLGRREAQAGFETTLSGVPEPAVATPVGSGVEEA